MFADLARAAVADLSADASAEKPDEAEVLLGRFEARQAMETNWEEARQLASAGDDENAFRLFNEARQLAEKHFGDDSIEFAEASNHMVGALTSIGEMDSAIAASRKAIEIYTARVGASDMRVLSEKSNLASRLAAIGSTEEARQLFEEILAGYEALGPMGGDVAYHAFALEGYSQFLARTGRGAEALVVARKASTMLESAGWPQTINHGWIRLNEARIARQVGDCEGSMASLAKAKLSMEAAGVAPSQNDHAQIIALLQDGCS